MLKVAPTQDNLNLFVNVGAITKESLFKAVETLAPNDPYKLIVIRGLTDLMLICEEQIYEIEGAMNSITNT